MTFSILSYNNYMKEATNIELIVGVLSLFIFFYRMVVIMFPLMQEGIKERNYGKVMNSLTLLV